MELAIQKHKSMLTKLVDPEHITENIFELKLIDIDQYEEIKLRHKTKKKQVRYFIV